MCIFVMLLELMHAVPFFLFLLDKAMPPYRVVLEALHDPVAFEVMLLDIDKKCPDEAHGYASQLVEVYRKIQTSDANSDAHAILDIMVDLQVRIDHADGRLDARYVVAWRRLSRYLGIVGLFVSISRLPICTVFV
jgi:hypothetical protein